MRIRTTWLLLAALLVIGAFMGIRSCQRGGIDPAATTPAAGSPATSPSAQQTDADLQAARLRAQIKQHDDALYAAVATLQKYLAALGGDDRAKADAFWAGQHPPEQTHEADLRSLKDLRGLRIENGRPQALDSEPVPAALEIPVELRVSMEGNPLRRYRGWYRLRRAVADGQWEITSASIDVVQRAE